MKKKNVDKYIPPLRDTDMDVPQEQWEGLSRNSEEEKNDFEEF